MRLSAYSMVVRLGRRFSMIHLDLTNKERQMLVEMLDIDISDLRMEIMETDSYGYKQMLKGRERVMKKILAALQQAREMVPAAWLFST
jgi:hypothetical protein